MESSSSLNSLIDAATERSPKTTATLIDSENSNEVSNLPEQSQSTEKKVIKVYNWPIVKYDLTSESKMCKLTTDPPKRPCDFDRPLQDMI